DPTNVAGIVLWNAELGRCPIWALDNPCLMIRCPEEAQVRPRLGLKPIVCPALRPRWHSLRHPLIDELAHARIRADVTNRHERRATKGESIHLGVRARRSRVRICIVAWVHCTRWT